MGVRYLALQTEWVALFFGMGGYRRAEWVALKVRNIHPPKRAQNRQKSPERYIRSTEEFEQDWRDKTYTCFYEYDLQIKTCLLRFNSA